MKSLNLPHLSTDSLGNSLFECVTLDAQGGRDGHIGDQPILVKAGVVCLCLRGEGTFMLNDSEHHLERGAMLTILPNTIIRNMRSSEDFLGYIVAANIKFMTTIKMSEIVKNYVNISANPVIHITDEQLNNLIEIAEVLRSKGKDLDHPFSKEISFHLLSVLCYEISALYSTHVAEEDSVSGGNSRQENLCRDFLALVEECSTHHRDIGFYADKLCITPKYLSVVVKKVTGRSPVDWVDRSVMLYARTMLTSSDMTVQQIAAELNFPNPSFFGQYFKRHEGVTPKHFRDKSKA